MNLATKAKLSLRSAPGHSPLPIGVAGPIFLLDPRVKCSSGSKFFENKRSIMFDHWIRFDRWQDRVNKIEAEKTTQRLLKQWLPRSKNDPFPPMYITPERLELDLPQKPFDERTREDHGRIGFDGIQRFGMLRYMDLSKEHLARKRRYDKLLALQFDQRLIPERQITLGADLAAAHFLVNRSAAVKFVGDDCWHQMTSKGDYVLPATRTPGLFLEAIDASKSELMYEAFDYLVRLKKLRYLNFSDCKHMTDWCLSRMNQFETSLEFLDLSNCKRISAKGLSSLACLKKLKYLRLDGLDHVTDIAKVAVMLEEKIHGLHISGIDYDTALGEVLLRDELLSDPHVCQDARGNVYLKDDLGDLYYLKGDVPERPVVDEDDLPLLHGKIRLDPPVVPYETAHRLNRLSGGKLKHLLSGSPSGDRNVETERILGIDLQRALKQGVRVDPILYPDSMQKEAEFEAQKQLVLSLANGNAAQTDEKFLLGTETVRLP